MLAGGFLVRTFIIPRLRARLVLQVAAAPTTSSGFITGVLTFTPYYHWRWEHALHHATSGRPRPARHRRRLDADGAGVPRVLALEALRLPPGAQSLRAVRARAAVSVPGPAALPVAPRRARASGTRCAGRTWRILGMAAALSAHLRHRDVPADPADRCMAVAGSAGVWLFYVQHQFEDVYWERGEDWDYTDGRAAGQLVLQAARRSCSGSRATSASTTSTI